jgi:hypothetical protein
VKVGSPFSPTSAPKKVVLLISNDLRYFSAVFLHYILHRFRTAWQTEPQVGQQHRDIFFWFGHSRSRTGNSIF